MHFTQVSTEDGTEESPPLSTSSTALLHALAPSAAALDATAAEASSDRDKDGSSEAFLQQPVPISLFAGALPAPGPGPLSHAAGPTAGGDAAEWLGGPLPSTARVTACQLNKVSDVAGPSRLSRVAPRSLAATPVLQWGNIWHPLMAMTIQAYFIQMDKARTVSACMQWDGDSGLSCMTWCSLPCLTLSCSYDQTYARGPNTLACFLSFFACLLACPLRPSFCTEPTAIQNAVYCWSHCSKAVQPYTPYQRGWQPGALYC